MTYVNLNRNFNAIPTHINDDIDLSDVYSEGFAKDENWEDVLLKNRVIILAEAGSGKTVEIKHKSEELSDAGNNSFFIRLEDIKDNFENAFDHGDIDLFNKWLNSSEVGYFFLDSVDEAKLSDDRDFKRAIRVFDSKLKSGKNRAKIFITSRGSVWKPKTDLELVNNSLKLPGDNGTFEVYSLSNLNLEQIKLFAKANNVDNSEELIQEITKHDAEVFTKRPLDLKGVIEYWNVEKKLGSRRELLDNSISKYLQDVDEERDKCEVSYDKLLSGTKEIAAALTFCRKSKISIPDIETDIDSLQLKTIFGSWRNEEITTLLSRPVFEPSIYGSHRFTQRIYREYLTALWINEKVESGTLDRKRLKKLFFQEKYGIEVPILSLKAVLSWYVLLDNKFATVVERLRPEIFIEGGDPSGLTVECRINLLKNFCLMYKEKSSCYITFDKSALLRFGSPEMEETVLVLLSEYYDNRPILQILLQMAITHQMKSCHEIALKISLDDSCESVARKLAIKLIKVILPASQISQNAKDVKGKYRPENNEFARIIIEEYADYLSVDEVLNILAQVSNPSSYGFSSIELTTEKYINSLSSTSLLTALRGLYLLIDTEPYKNGYRSKISEKYKWLVKVFEIGLVRYLESRDDALITAELLAFISKIQNNNEMKHNSSSNGNLLKVIQDWKSLNYEVFWNNIESERVRKLGKAHAATNSRITYWYEANWIRSLWLFSHSDLLTVMGWINTKGLTDDRLVAISLAWKLIDENGRDDKVLKELIALAPSVDGGKEMVDSFLNPVKPDWQLEDENRKAEQLIEKKEDERKAQENLIESKEYVSRNKHVITDIRHAKTGEFNGVQQYLLRRIGEANENNHSWSWSNWKSLVPDFGEEAANLYKDASISYWKEFEAPLLLSEGGCEHKETFIMAISGVFIENELDSDWSLKITKNDAIKAIKLAICEMNGLPVWFEGLYKTFPTEVVDIFIKEIRWLYANQEVKNINGYVLGQVLNNEEYLIEEISRSIYEELYKTKVTDYGILKKSLCIISKSEGITDVELADLAKIKLNVTSLWGDVCKVFKKAFFMKSKSVKTADNDIISLEESNEVQEIPSIWWAILISSDAKNGLGFLKRHLATLKFEKATELAIAIVSELSDKGYHDVLTERTSHNTVSSRLSLYKLIHKYIREVDDINRSGGGCYSPTKRDDAQDSRNNIFNLMCETPGKASYQALIKIANMWKHIPFRHTRIKHLALERAEKDAEFQPMIETSFVEFSISLNKDNNSSTINNYYYKCKVLKTENTINFGEGNTIINSPITQGSSGTTITKK